MHERHIAAEDQHQIPRGNMRQRLPERMAGAQLLGLPDPARIPGGKGPRQQFLAMAIDNINPAFREFRRRFIHMPEQGLAGKCMQHLRLCGIHPSALTGREDNDTEWHAMSL